MILLSLPCVLGFNVWSGFTPFGPGTGVLDLEDFFVSYNLLPLGSLVYLAFCTSRYGWGWKNFLREADPGRGVAFPQWIPLLRHLYPAAHRAGDFPQRVLRAVFSANEARRGSRRHCWRFDREKQIEIASLCVFRDAWACFLL
jgi:hypothetical protein